MIPNGVRRPLPINIKGNGRFSVSNQSKHINLLLFITFCLIQILALQPFYLLFFLCIDAVWRHSRWHADPPRRVFDPCQPASKTGLTGLSNRSHRDWATALQCMPLLDARTSALVCWPRIHANTFWRLHRGRQRRDLLLWWIYQNLVKLIPTTSLGRLLMNCRPRIVKLIWSLHEGAWRGEHLTQI